ncbi:MAG: copper amine oxidase N-terminal domain-containing protein [Bacillota bacterium]
MSRKPAVAGILCLLLVVTSFSVVLCGDSANGMFEGYPIVKVQLNGEEVAFDVPAINLGGRTLVPIRFVAEKMGALVGWDEQSFTAFLTTKGVLGSVEPRRGAPDKGVYDRLTESQLAEALAYGVGLQTSSFDAAFSKYISWDSSNKAWGVLYTEYSWVAWTAYNAATTHEEVPTASTAVPQPQGLVRAYIGFTNEWPGSLDKFKFYVRQGAIISEALTYTYPSKVQGMQASETAWISWYTTGMDLSMPVSVIIAKPDGSSYNLSWNLFELK